MTIVSLDAALLNRMALFSQAMTERVPHPGEWAGYCAEEGLISRLTRPDSLGGALTAEYQRKGYTGATCAMAWLTMTDVQEESRGPVTVLGEEITEDKTFDLDLPAGVVEKVSVARELETIHTGGTAYSNAAKQSWEAGGKASLSIAYAGVTGAVEAFGKYGEEASQSTSGHDDHSERQKDSDSAELTFTGPVTTELRAKRSRRREQRVVTARCDFDGKVYWTGGDGAWEFTTYATQFIPIAMRVADDSIYGYDEFRNKPLSDAEIEALTRPSDALVSFVVSFDNVLSQSLKRV